MSSTRKTPVAAIAATLVASLVMSSAFAQAVPVPKPAPKRTDAPRPSAPLITAPGGQAAAEPPNPILPDLSRLFSGPAPTFDANQKIWAGKVSAYLSSVQNLSGNFVQVGPDGKRTTGDFYIQKPGKVRFEYDDPNPIALVADGFHFHIPRGYIYFAIAFSAAVEFFNVLARRNRKRTGR